MSHTSSPDRSAPTTLAGRSIQPRFGQLEQGCRRLAMSHLDQYLAHAFERVDDALFEQAERAANNQEQALFFDGMRVVRKQRTQIIRHFHQQLAGGFAAWLEGRDPHSATPAPAAHDQLSLVAHEEHEENVLMSNLIGRSQSDCARLLQALEQRLAQLRPPQAESSQENPFGPTAIAEAFRQALSGENLPRPIRHVLYDLFEQQVMCSLDSLYEDLNQYLIDAGILPQLGDRPPQPRRAARTPAGMRGAASAARRPALGNDGQGSPGNDAEQLFQGVTHLLSRRHRGSDASLADSRAVPMRPGLPPPPPAGTYSENELIAALTRLQQLSASEIAGQLQQPQDVDQLRARLHTELEAACTLPERQQLNAADADIIDLVGMLFAFILDDPALPDRCKTVLSHLHTPYLKLALRDRQLFTRGDHPARRLLDSMAKAGARFAEDSDASGLLARIQATVERIIQDFSEDPSLFGRLLQEFEEDVRRLQQRVELREQRTLGAARGRDRLHAARREAGEQIGRVLFGRSPPPLIRELLEIGWRDVLALIHLRQGEQSDDWQQGCQVAEQLAWSCTPLSRDERERMQRTRLTLLEQLRGGLQQLGNLAESDIRRLLQDVVACQHAVQARQPELVAELTARLPDSTLGALLHAQGDQDDDEPKTGNDSGAALPPELEAQLQRLQELPFGSLFGFSEDGQLRRLRLSWFSPATRHYLFIDPSGEHSRTWPAARLARALHDGSVRLLGEPTDTPMMERALQAIYRVLQRLEEGQPIDS